MKINIMRIMVIKEELDKLFNKDLPINASWKISKFIRRIEQEYEDFERNRIKIIKGFADEEGTVPDDKKKDVHEKIEDLLNVEVEVDIEPIDISELGNVSLPPMSLAKMHFLFKETEPPEEE